MVNQYRFSTSYCSCQTDQVIIFKEVEDQKIEKYLHNDQDKVIILIFEEIHQAKEIK